MWEIKFMVKKDATEPKKSHKDDITLPTLNSVYRLSTTSRMISDLHAAAFFLIKSTCLEKFQKNFYATWSFLTYAAVKKYLSPYTTTSKAHIKQVQKNFAP